MNDVQQCVFLCFSSPFRNRGTPQCSPSVPSRDVSCTRLASACASASPPGKTRLAGDTDVDVGIEMAVGTLVACDSVNHALTCRWALACLSRGGQCLHHHARLLRASGRQPRVWLPFFFCVRERKMKGTVSHSKIPEEKAPRERRAASSH